MTKVIFIPGNGGSTTRDNWFPAIEQDLKSHGIEVIAATFPDPYLARESFWIPFLKDTLKADKDTILVGYSSGAIAALKFAQQYPILGSVLVGVYHTDLGIEEEKLSGYFDTPWHWKTIRENQQWTVIFAAQDDPWIPIHEPRYIHKQLNCEYHEYKNQGHFGAESYFKKSFKELSLAIIRNIKEKA